MFNKILRKLEIEASGEIAFNYVSEIIKHHRIQASPGIRAAVHYVVREMGKRGLEAKVDSYKADGKTYSWSSLHFKEWECSEAELKIIEPYDEACFLARWAESKLSLIQRSHPTPKTGIEAELVLLEKGEEEKDYRGLDLKNKIVITNGDIGRVYDLAVNQRGAIGIIFDGTWIRPPALLEGELDDALRYTSFFWVGDEKPCFGFVITPRKGRWIRKLLKDNKKSVKVLAKVDSKFYEGSTENAIVKINGKTDDEVVIVAHICHPQPSANDNASGSGAAMEAARALNQLIENGTIEKPKRTIKFTFVPEMTGTYNFLASNEKSIPNIVAALNLDMVGEKQSLTGGPLIVERTPESNPSYVNALLVAIYENVRAESGNLGGSAKYPLFKYAVTPFSGGSDHYIYSDPSVGVGCPMIIQWPDKFWHTSYDTIDKVDPAMLKRVAIMTATYAYSIANADTSDAIWLANEVTTRGKKIITEKIQSVISKAAEIANEKDAGKELAKLLSELKRIVPYQLDQNIKALQSVRRLNVDDKIYESQERELITELEQVAKFEKIRGEMAIKRIAETKGLSTLPKIRKRLDKKELEAQSIVVKRLFRGPVSTRLRVRKLSWEDRDALWKLGRDHPNSGILGTLAMYWADGKRDLLEISRLVELEAGRTDLQYLMKHFKLLQKMSLVDLS